jgi:heat-inducible transcriptional repressor
MQSSSITELSTRAREIFRQIVESYVETGTPVGSRTLSKLSGLGLSAASIRNVMQDLEEMGLLASPHTSAGRIPTETGLRLFVDGMMQAAEMSLEERQAIERQLHARSGRIEEALAETTAVLSGLSACASIVLVPKGEPIVRQIGFVPLSQNQALAVLVGADGSVENRVMDLPVGVSPSALVEAGNYVSARLSGLTLQQAAQRLDAEIRQGRAAIDHVAQGIVAQGLASWSQDGSNRPVLIVRGQAHLLDQGTVADLERIRQLLDELEGKQELVKLLEGARKGEGMKIFIGSENKLFSLSGSSVIAAPYFGGEGKVVGVVGVIGPTRLNYARVVPMVDYTAQALTRLMA